MLGSPSRSVATFVPTFHNCESAARFDFVEMIKFDVTTTPGPYSSTAPHSARSLLVSKEAFRANLQGTAR